MSLPSDLKAELDTIRTERAFDPVKFTNERTREFLKYLQTFNIGSVVLSVSGGVDSACVCGLLKRAQDLANKIPSHPFNIANGGKIIALSQPIGSTEQIYSRAFELEEAFGIKVRTICQDEIYRALVSEIERALGTELSPFSASMLKSYMRTPPAYAVASSTRGVVIGTGNYDEDGYLYYYCKFGDGAVDIGLIWDLHKSEVFKLGEYLGVPQSILVAPPSADLFSGQTDENEIGFSYDYVELVVNWIYWDKTKQTEFESRISPESKMLFERAKTRIQELHVRGAHKADLNPKNMGSYQFVCPDEIANVIDSA